MRDDFQLEFDLYLIDVYLEQLKKTPPENVKKWIDEIPPRLRNSVFLALALAFRDQYGF